MKRLKYVYGLLLLSALLFQGCSSEEGIVALDVSNFYFQFNIDRAQQGYRYGNNQVNFKGGPGYNNNTRTYSINTAGLSNISENRTNVLSVYISKTGGFFKDVNYSHLPEESDHFPDFSSSRRYYDNEESIFIMNGAGDKPPNGLYQAELVNVSDNSGTHMSSIFSGMLTLHISGTKIFIGCVVILDGKFNVPSS